MLLPLQPYEDRMCLAPPPLTCYLSAVKAFPVDGLTITPNSSSASAPPAHEYPSNPNTSHRKSPIGSPYWFRANLCRFKGGVGPRPRGYWYTVRVSIPLPSIESRAILAIRRTVLIGADAGCRPRDLCLEDRYVAVTPRPHIGGKLRARFSHLSVPNP